MRKWLSKSLLRTEDIVDQDRGLSWRVSINAEQHKANDSDSGHAECSRSIYDLFQDPPRGRRVKALTNAAKTVLGSYAIPWAIYSRT